MAALFIGIGKLLPRIPNSMINIPNREYWLAPERRAETMSANESVLVWIAACTAWLMVGGFQLTFEANVNPQGDQSLNTMAFFVMMVVYSIAIVICVVFLIRRFSKPAFESPT